MLMLAAIRVQGAHYFSQFFAQPSIGTTYSLANAHKPAGCELRVVAIKMLVISINSGGTKTSYLRGFGSPSRQTA